MRWATSGTSSACHLQVQDVPYSVVPPERIRHSRPVFDPAQTRHDASVAEPSEFDLTLAFPLLSGPFKAHLTVADGFIEVRPAAPWLLSKLPWFRSERVSAEDVTVVRGDSPSRSGLRVETVDGALDRFILMPFTPAERASVHASMRAHGYTVE